MYDLYRQLLSRKIILGTTVDCWCHILGGIQHRHGSNQHSRFLYHLP